MNTRIYAALVALLIGLLAGCNQATRDAGPVLTTGAGVAIQGYDPVAYFTDAAAVQGKPEFSAAHNGATWWFASAEHRDMFVANPEKFAPAYGGWCAYGLAEGYAAETDPVNGWTIHEGRLYLNWDADISAQWNAERARYLQRSEANWPEVNSQLKAGSATVYWHE